MTCEITNNLQAHQALFNAQAIVGIIKEVYLDENGEKLDKVMIGRALDVSFGILNDVAEFLDSKPDDHEKVVP